MKSVYETSLGIEAHLIKNLLSMNDFESEIFGEHLQGGVGDLQAGGIIRVMVADHDYSAAHKIVADWEASQPAVSEPHESKKVNSYGAGLIGFLLGAITVIVLTMTPITEDGIDYDGDGVLDERWQYAGGLLRESKVDNNRDGQIDTTWRYDFEGLLKSASFDQNFDGRFEYKCHYREGNISWCRGDYDGDGFAEFREDYESSVLQKNSIYNPESQIVKKIQYYEGGRLKRAEVDLDDDGVLETKYTYDAYDEIQSP